MKNWITLTVGPYAGTSINPASRDVAYRKEGSRMFVTLGGGRVWEIDPADQEAVSSKIRKVA